MMIEAKTNNELKLTIYKLEKEDYDDVYILKYDMDDEFKSKRYYYLSLAKNEVYRIKNIDNFIEYCDQNNISIIKINLSRKEINEMKEIIAKTIHFQNNDGVLNKDNYYDSLDNLAKYDYMITDINPQLHKDIGGGIHKWTK